MVLDDVITRRFLPSCAAVSRIVMEAINRDLSNRRMSQRATFRRELAETLGISADDRGHGEASLVTAAAHLAASVLPVVVSAVSFMTTGLLSTRRLRAALGAAAGRPPRAGYAGLGVEVDPS